MRVFLDECIDWRLSRAIVGHEVLTARQMGWSGVKNGKLLELVAREFDAFITVDRNLAFQQPIPSLPVAVVVLRATSNRLSALTPLIPSLLAALRTINPRTVCVVDA